MTKTCLKVHLTHDKQRNVGIKTIMMIVSTLILCWCLCRNRCISHTNCANITKHSNITETGIQFKTGAVRELSRTQSATDSLIKILARWIKILSKYFYNALHSIKCNAIVKSHFKAIVRNTYNKQDFKILGKKNPTKTGQI